LEVDYDLSLTQRLILQPRAELNVYGKEDRAAGVGSGLSDGAFGIRLRYDVCRELAPYLGVERVRRFGQSADFARADGLDSGDTRVVAGLRIWY
jgi:copper resistance protein B